MRIDVEGCRAKTSPLCDEIDYLVGIKLRIISMSHIPAETMLALHGAQLLPIPRRNLKHNIFRRHNFFKRRNHIPPLRFSMIPVVANLYVGSLVIPVIHAQRLYQECQSAALTTLRSSVMTRLRRVAKASLQHS